MSVPRAMCALLVSCLGLRASFHPISQPDTGYVNSTSIIGIPETGSLNSLSDVALTIGFSRALDRRVVGVDWSTWGNQPATEGAYPTVLVNWAATLQLTFSKPLSTFGLEAENDFGTAMFTAVFYDGATEVGRVAQYTTWNGAKLFAASTDGQFTRVDLSTTDELFAIARPRYTLAADNSFHQPEPETMVLLGAGLVLLLLGRRARV